VHTNNGAAKPAHHRTRDSEKEILSIDRHRPKKPNTQQNKAYIY
jgi:hypothetical protein